MVQDSKAAGRNTAKFRSSMTGRRPASLEDIRALADHRYHIRTFFRASEPRLKSRALSNLQYELLLQIKATPASVECTISHMSERLQRVHHGTVQLTDRMVRRGLVRRKRAQNDRRQVLLQLTAKGEATLRGLAAQQYNELRCEAPNLIAALRRLMDSGKI